MLSTAILNKGSAVKTARDTPFLEGHSHVFLGSGHEQNERKVWAVIFLCGVMMVVEIVGGSLFGSLALVADGLHMSTHAGAMLIAALAYTYARRHVGDARFVFGTGKLGDLAGFSSAIVLAMIATLIGYEAVSRFLSPVPIHFREAIPIAIVGLVVNITSAWLLSGTDHHGHGHTHGHGHAHGHPGHEHDLESHRFTIAHGSADLEIFEDGVPPRFVLSFSEPQTTRPLGIEIVRSNGQHQVFSFTDRGDYWESVEEIPEPHAFKAILRLPEGEYQVVFEEHPQDVHEGLGPASASVRDNSLRAAYIHVIADAVVSILAITGLVLARMFGWLWMDPLAGIVGALVIANWSYGLIRDTGGILLDMSPDPALAKRLSETIESDGDRLTDLHLWRLGPGHLGVVVSVVTGKPRDPAFYRGVLSRFKTLSHVTVEVTRAAA
jgi:cation diffusion facilitator family transporter